MEDKEKRLNALEAFELSIKTRPDFWAHYARLFKQPNPCDLATMIDQATGYSDAVLDQAFIFFMKYVWDTMPQDDKLSN
jgi:hypothetical protein